MFAKKWSKQTTALLEVGILFIPAIPAYIWIWPNISGAKQEIFQIISYIYVIAGTFFISLRRWRLDELGFNLKGFWVSLGASVAILAGRLIIILSVNFGLEKPDFSPLETVGWIIYYFLLVGLGEEFLFRGLLYHALEGWRGTRWAIFGSSFGFLLWHIFGQGPVIGITTFFIGLAFAVIRWRSGSITWLIILHALYDIETAFSISGSNQQILQAVRPDLPHPALTLVGFALMVVTPFFLWLAYPSILAWVRTFKHAADS